MKKKLKILIVDDDFVNLEFLDELLSIYGETRTVESGVEALHAFHIAHAKSAPYDLITLDIGIPDISGNEVLEKIREWEHTAKIDNKDQEAKIIMVTAKTAIKDRLKSLSKGCEEFISKPIQQEKLSTVLANLDLI